MAKNKIVLALLAAACLSVILAGCGQQRIHVEFGDRGEIAGELRQPQHGVEHGRLVHAGLAAEARQRAPDARTRELERG